MSSEKVPTTKRNSANNEIENEMKEKTALIHVEGKILSVSGHDNTQNNIHNDPAGMGNLLWKDFLRSDRIRRRRKEERRDDGTNRSSDYCCVTTIRVLKQIWLWRFLS